MDFVEKVTGRRLEARSEGRILGVWRIKENSEQTFKWALRCALTEFPNAEYVLVTETEYTESLWFT